MPRRLRIACLLPALLAGSVGLATLAARGTAAGVSAAHPDSLDARVERLLRAGGGRADSTLSLARQALAVRREASGDGSGGETREGPSSVEPLAAAHRRLARVLQERGDFAGSREQLEGALRVWLSAAKPDTLGVAQARRDLSGVLVQLAEFPAAREQLELALRAQETALGPQAPEVAATLNALGSALFTGGDPTAAREVYERALAIRTQTFGEDSLEAAESLLGLGACAFQLSDLVAARAALERALRIRETRLGPRDRLLGPVLSSLGAVLATTGNLVEARPTLERALELRREHFGPEHPATGVALQNLAACVRDLGLLQEARTLFEQALAIAEKTRGPDHPYVALGLAGLADLDRRLGDYDAALSRYERALTITEKRFGPEHPETALLVGDLGQLHRHRGEHRTAKPYYERQLKVLEAAYGPENYRVGDTLALLGMIEFHLGEDAAALAHSLRAESLCRQHVQYTALTQSEREALDYARRRTTGVDVPLTLAAQGRIPGSQLVAETWDALLRSRGIVLDEMASRLRPLERGADSTAATLREQYAQASRTLAARIVEGPGDQSRADFEAEVTSLRRDREAIERTLAQHSSAFRDQRERTTLGFDDIRRTLPAGSALVAFARFDRILEEDSPLRGPRVNPDSPEDWLGWYVALVQRADGSPPVAVTIGAERDVEARVADWRGEVARVVPRRGAGRVRAEEAYLAAGTALRALVWDPLVPALGDADRVFVVPDGPLHLVNFATLPTGERSFLLETGPLLHTLTTERDLVPQQDAPAEAPSLAAGAAAGAASAAAQGPLLALGGVAFDAVEPETRDDVLASATLSTATYRGTTSACASFRDLRFAPLPASGAEARAIARLWETARAVPPPASGATTPGARRAIELQGAGASEANFKRLAAGCEVLHLATHGFFLGDACVSGFAAGRGVGTLVPATDLQQPGGDRTLDAGASEPENPLLLSGLVLAGANQRATAGPQQEDGILTAEEITALDLRGTRWAVLSACDSGIGPVTATEGVFGLRRAFRMAGARTVIMGLWSVDDDIARDWMEELYRQRFVDGRGTAEAVRAAARKLLDRCRAKKRSPHPSSWGAFTAAGEWH